MITTHEARVHSITAVPTRRADLTRWEIMLNLGSHHGLIGSDYLVAATVDPFAAETFRLAHERGCPVWTEVRASTYGYDVISVELASDTGAMS